MHLTDKDGNVYGWGGLEIIGPDGKPKVIDQGLTSVGLSMPSAFTVSNSPLTSNGVIGVTGAGTNLEYIDGTGALRTFPSLTGYVPYTGATQNVNLGVYDLTANSLIKAGGTSTQFLKADGSVDNSAYITLTALSAAAPLNYNNLTGAFSIAQATASSNGYLSSTDWNVFNGKQNAITLTTIGSSGPATFIGSTLNIPDYNSALTGYVPNSRTLTINGTTYDLSANRTWNVGTVTAVTATGPLSSSGGTTPDITISQASGTDDGYLSSTDWTTFNNKQPAGNYITDLSGEATGSGPGVASVTLNNASVTAKVLTGVNIIGGSISASDSILTAFGKLQNQINGLIGSSIYQGVWNAATNNPTLTSGVGTRGYYYIVNVAGSTNLDGITDWNVGDWAIFDGTAWQQVDNTDSVTSVNGLTGAVNLTTDNIPEGAVNQYFTNLRARQSISLTTTGTSGAATYNNGTGVLNIPQYQSALTNPVTGTGITNYVARWISSSEIGTGALYDNGTNVGIGFTGPFLANLHVNGSSIITGPLTVQGSPTDLQYTVINSDLDIIQGQAEANNYGTYSRLRLFRASGTIASPTTPSSGTAIGRLEFGAYNSGTATFLANAKIEASMDATTGANDLPSRLGFFTTPDGSTTMVERMRINNTGLIRIGGTTMNFSDVLNIQAGSIAFQNGYGLRFTNTLGTPYASVYSSNNNTVIKSLGTAVLIKDISGANDIITALDGGDVGIGTSNPNAKLHVNGTFISNALWTDNTSVGYWGTYSTAYGYLTWDAGFARIGSMPGNRLDFSTNGSTLAMTIATDGNIGIGTSNPGYKLTVDGFIFAIDYYIQNSSGTNGTFRLDGYQDYLYIWGDSSALAGYRFGSDTAGVVAQIGTNGNVGIGTTTPANKLSISSGTFNNGATVASILNTSSTQKAHVVYDTFLIQQDDAPTLRLYETLENLSTTISSDAGLTSFATTGEMGLFVAGSSTAPGWTGLNGIQAVRIKSNGNVGIGTTNPLGPLEVYRSAPGSLGGYIVINNDGSSVFNETALMFGDGPANGIRAAISTTTENSPYYGQINFKTGAGTYSSLSTRMTITGAGNVGIGTTSTLRKLTVAGGHDDTTATLYASGGWGTASLDMWASEPGITLEGSGIGNNVNSSPYYGRRTTAYGQSYLRFYLGEMIFNTGATTASEAMRITTNGNIGVGTTSPSSLLSGTEKVLEILNSNVASLYLNSTTGRRWSISSISNGTLTFWDISSVAERMRIDTSGNVGINTSSPSEKLHVSGNVRVTGAYYDSNNQSGTSGQILSSTGSGTDWVDSPTATATSVSQLLPSATVNYSWTGQVIDGTWVDIFTRANNILTSGVWTVTMYVSDFGQGGNHYQYRYSGTMTWYQGGTNQTGLPAASEIALHRMGHAANNCILYLRTTEEAASDGGNGKLQINANYSNTSNTTITFTFVKII